MSAENPIANIEWRNGQPYASAFDDVYFSTDNGLLETDYVFLQGNDLANRWQHLSTPMSTQTFTIAETGFGTGLNFLCAAQLWLATAPKNAILHYISTEKYPLNVQDFTAALQLWPTLSPLSTPLLNGYENMLNHAERYINAEACIFMGNRIQLSLLIGDATACFSTLDAKNTNIDAWFLDGFSPAKNPDMWQAALFNEMARLSSKASTFATFTSAGAVRRGLMASGFEVTKRTGFGKKREMLIGSFVGSSRIR